MKVITKTVNELTKDEYAACRVANYGPDGYMRYVLQDYRKKDGDKAIVIMLWESESTGLSRLLGWALLTPCTTRGMLGVTRYTKSKSKYTAQFWVKRQHRKKGYGKILMREVKTHDPRPHVLPHDPPSAEFFSSWHVTVLSYDRVWMKPTKRKVA